MSSFLYLAAALIGTTPAAAYEPTSSPATQGYAQGVRDLRETFDSSSNDWISARQLTADSNVEEVFGPAAEHQHPNVGAVFSQETHWAANSNPAFLAMPDDSTSDARLSNRQLREHSWSGRSGTVIRAQDAGQSPAYDEVPRVNSNLDQPILLPPTSDQPWLPPGGPLWGGNEGMGAPNGTPIGSQYGTSGARPFRFGSQWKIDIGYLPDEQMDSSVGRLGNLSIFEVNTELRYTAPTQAQYVWSIAPQFNWRSYNANPPVGTAQIPSSNYRFGADLQLTSPDFGGYSMELGFNPSLNTDFQQNLTSDAWNLDGRAALFFRPSPHYTIVLGAMYWDRVDSMVLPWVGWVYTPNDRLEVRAVFPTPQISYFLGTPWGVPQWWYVAAEYHVEAYQVEVNRPGLSVDRMQFEDWRVTTGLRSESLGCSSFIEAGWVFGRNVKYRSSIAPADFDISSGFIARFGLRF